MKPRANFTAPKAAQRPELLTHPNIPKPLHGLAPREVKGKAWWDKVRRKAYAENNYHCWACGKYAKTDEKWNRPFLEAHENYHINYGEGFMEITEITALCHLCHSFIHSGRMRAICGSEQMPKEKAEYILKRGFRILKRNDLTPFAGTAKFYADIFDSRSLESAEVIQRLQTIEIGQIQQDWTKWYLLLEGERYYSKFRDFDDWRNYYD